MSFIHQFPRTSPEAEGIPSDAVLNFLRAAEQHQHPLDALHGFLLIRHGNVAAEGWWAPYQPESPHTMFSVSKSYTSTAIGFAVSEGLLTVEDSVLSFFPEDAPTDPSPNLQAMKVKHLLSMNTGHQEDTTGQVWRGEDANWPRTFLALPVENEPGTWFVYNTAATYMLSAIITKLTDISLLEYLTPRLFDPLGITRPTWDVDPAGRNLGGSGLHIRTEDIARLAQLYLQKGEWQGEQLLPATWIAEATSAHSDNSNTQTNPDWTVGYGYQFWRCRHDAYRGDGAFGQYCLVLPEQDAVLAITSGLGDMQRILDLVWEHLLPAMQSEPLPEDPESQAALTSALATLSLPLPPGTSSSPRAAEWSGTTFILEPNDMKLETISLEFGEAASELVIRNAEGEQRIPIGHGSWAPCSADLHGEVVSIASSGAWTTENSYQINVCSLEGVNCPVFRLTFATGSVVLEVEPNISWGAITVTSINGVAS